MKYNSYIFKVLMLLAGVGAFTSSCEDMLESDSKFVIYDEHLTSPADTANSLVGIIYNLQAIAERTHLLGEVRGDLVSVKSSADEDLLQMANFTMDDDNKYNNPRDYYAVINNCNYYIAHADLNAVNSSAERIFWREYVQVKTIRAWTYLQLALNYGSVQFYTEPILTEADAEKEYPRKTLEEICTFFIEELTSDPTFSTTEFPSLHSVGNLMMANCFFPVDLVLGDLYLWRASIKGSVDDYRNAALRYSAWILRKGNVGGFAKSQYNIPSDANQVRWREGLHTEPTIVDNNNGTTGSYTGFFYSSRAAADGEVVTMIPMDSLAYQGYYNNMRYLYTNMDDGSEGNNSIRKADFYITPSVYLQELSGKQHFAYYYMDAGMTSPRPFEVPDSKLPLNNGDLRLSAVYSTATLTGSVLEGSTDIQLINKPCTGRDIWIYRKTDLFLRLAEALNNGGFPHLAHMILARGVDGNVIRDSISAVYWNDDQKTFYDRLNVDNGFSQYQARNGFKAFTGSEDMLRTMGIHSRGCGYAELDPKYAYPEAPYNDEYNDKKAGMEEELRALIAKNWESFDESDFLQKMYGNNNGFKKAFPTLGSKYAEEDVFVKLWNEGDAKSVTETAEDGTTSKVNMSITPYKVTLSKWWSEQSGNKEQEQREVDQLILDEMALETCMEGKRFYDLMRFAMRYNDNEIVAGPVSKRGGNDAQNGALYSRLLDRNNWFMKWQGKMGF